MNLLAGECNVSAEFKLLLSFFNLVSKISYTLARIRELKTAVAKDDYKTYMEESYELDASIFYYFPLTLLAFICNSTFSFLF